MTIDLDALEARYTEESVPPCAVCGAELTIGSMGGGEPTRWHCSALIDYSPAERDHWRRSTFVQRRRGDSDVRALVAQVRRYRAVLEQIADSSGRLTSYDGMPCHDCVELISLADAALYPDGH